MAKNRRVEKEYTRCVLLVTGIDKAGCFYIQEGDNDIRMIRRGRRMIISTSLRIAEERSKESWITTGSVKCSRLFLE